jgi:hypothetical protein
MISLDGAPPVLLNLQDPSLPTVPNGGPETVQSAAVWGMSGLANTKHVLVVSMQGNSAEVEMDGLMCVCCFHSISLTYFRIQLHSSRSGRYPSHSYPSCISSYKNTPILISRIPLTISRSFAFLLRFPRRRSFQYLHQEGHRRHHWCFHWPLHRHGLPRCSVHGLPPPHPKQQIHHHGNSQLSLFPRFRFRCG